MLLQNAMEEKAIELKGLSKHFGQVLAVDNISFAVEKGEITPCGVLRTNAEELMSCEALPGYLSEYS